MARLGNDGLPADAVRINVTLNAVAAEMLATMPAVPGWRNVLCGFQVTGTGATAASAIDIVTTGCAAGENPRLRLAVPAGAVANAPNTAWSPSWPFGIPAAGPNVAIVVTVPSFGAGNTGAAINLYGYRIPDKGGVG
jgi:hypothetical protein